MASAQDMERLQLKRNRLEKWVVEPWFKARTMYICMLACLRYIRLGKWVVEPWFKARDNGYAGVAS